VVASVMPTALPAQTSPEELRKAIIARLGITPDKLVAFGGGPAFDDQIRNLYRTATQKYADLDTSEARAGQDYELGLANMQRNQRLDTRRMMNDLGDRGLAFSGAAINRRAQLGQTYADRLQGLTTARTRGLEDVSSARNQALNSLLSGRSAYESGYTQQLQDWLQQQAQASAQTTLGQPITPTATATKSVTKKTPAGSTTVKTTTPVNHPAVKQTAVKLPGGTTGYRAPGGRTQF
jgi:hypothetical protein